MGEVVEKNGTKRSDGAMRNLLYALAVTLAAIVSVYLWGGPEGKEAVLPIAGIATPIFGALILIVQNRETARITAEGLAEAARITAEGLRLQVEEARAIRAEAEAIRREQVQTQAVLANVSKQVDGMTKERVEVEGEKARAVATLAERDRGEGIALVVKAEADATLAAATASVPALGTTPGDAVGTSHIEVEIADPEIVVKKTAQKPKKAGQGE